MHWSPDLPSHLGPGPAPWETLKFMKRTSNPSGPTQARTATIHTLPNGRPKAQGQPLQWGGEPWTAQVATPSVRLPRLLPPSPGSTASQTSAPIPRRNRIQWSSGHYCNGKETIVMPSRQPTSLSPAATAPAARDQEFIQGKGPAGALTSPGCSTGNRGGKVCCATATRAPQVNLSVIGAGLIPTQGKKMAT